MSHPSPGDPDRVARLEQRILQLERALIAHNIRIPDETTPAHPVGGSMDSLGFPELDFSEPERKGPEALDLRAALEAFPHISRAITLLWGHDGFDEYLAKLIVDERGTRKGFAMDAMEELLFLARVARARKALFGMGFDRPPRTEPWADDRDANRRATR